jgi:hypothetical protein
MVIVFVILTILACACAASAQQSLKSILINHGSASCASTAGEQQMFTGVLTNTPGLLATCTNGIPFYNAFTAYNPKDKKIYFADISNSGTTKMYALNYNFSGVINCPQAITPDYVYNYGISQLCFDQDGNNLAIYNYNAGTGMANVKRIDVASGNDIAGTDRPLAFPAGNAPNSLSWGDMVFMPNGRVFMTFGNTPSKLYELINFDGPGNAEAVFLTNIPKPCFSIGYVDGSLLVAGSDGSSCYYYIWDIDNQTLSTEAPFPLGKSTADITHMNVGAGASEELIGGSIVNSNTADIIYHVVIKNKGNIDLTNVQLSNRLTNTFGQGNVSNVVVSFVSNPGGLVLNPSYNGDSDSTLLMPGQQISNYPVSVDSAVIRIRFRATNLLPTKIYYNSSLVSGSAGAGANMLQVIDSSNNGTAAVIDVNANGVSDDAGEGYPTPFVYNILLPLSQLNFTAVLQNNQVLLQWNNRNEQNLSGYELEKSSDGVHFTTIAKTNRSANGTYQYNDKAISNSTIVYYRLGLLNAQGGFSYSSTVSINLNNKTEGLSIYPNPFTDAVTIKTNATTRGIANVKVIDASGKTVKEIMSAVQPGMNFLSCGNLTGLTRGIYYIQVSSEGKLTQSKLIKN